MRRFLLLWLAGALLIAIGLGGMNMPRLYPLMRRGVKTCGTVTSFEPNKHRTVHYSFQAQEKSYSGTQSGGEEMVSFSNCNGHVVYYLPEDPYVSCIGNPAPMFNNEAPSILLTMLTFPPVALLGWRWRFPRFRRWLNAEPREGVQNPPLPT
jgi:hypothetical protein